MWGGNPWKMQWLPMPSSGMTANKTFDDAVIQLENGGATSVRSSGYHLEYEMSWAVREAQQAGGLDLYGKYAAGYYAAPPIGYGSEYDLKDLFYFANPINFQSNLMAAQWATPMFCGYPPNFPPIQVTASLNQTVANNYDQPIATWTFDTTDEDVQYNTSLQYMLIPVPPTHSLWAGFSGGSTGAGTVGIARHKVSDGTFDRQNVLDPSAGPYQPGFGFLDPAGQNRLGAAPIADGATYDYVIIFLGSKSAQGTPGTVSLTSSMAQLWPTGITPDPTGGQGGLHIHGEGNTGLAFTDSAIAETYIQVINGENRHYKGLSTKFVEVEPWSV